MNVVIVGAGRLGRSLEVLLAARGHAVTVAERQAGQLGLGPNPADPNADVVLVCVPDRAIPDVAKRLVPGVVALHTSGAQPVDALAPHHPRGSLHPLMTFPGPELGLPDLTGVPAAIAGEPRAKAIAQELAVSLGLSAFEVPGDRRLYHAAAVVAGNFATVLLARAAEILVAAGVPESEARDRLLPLAIASIRNASGGGPLLTGPVARGDHETIDGHREALDRAGLKQTRKLYDTLVKHAESLRSPPKQGG